jgi:hypothetical protein
MKPLQIAILKPPIEHLRALLEITQRNIDAAKLSDPEAAELVDMLWSIAHQRPATRAELAEGLRELHRWFSELTIPLRGAVTRAELGSGGIVEVSVSGLFVYGLTEDGEIQRSFSGSFAFALVDETWNLLQRAGPGLLRVCPLRLRSGDRCNRIFIAKRHQKYCIREHAQIHARRESRRRKRELNLGRQRPRKGIR